MHIYKHDLDKFMQNKLDQSRKLNTKTEANIKYSENYHNPLINPLPFNIQNPYLIKEIQKNNSQMMRNGLSSPIHDYDNYQAYQQQVNYDQQPQQINQQERPRN
jgi:DNA polymerase sigma